jgi:hypothetical protein
VALLSQFLASHKNDISAMPFAAHDNRGIETGDADPRCQRNSDHMALVKPPTIVPQHVELILVVAGNQDGLVRRTGPGFCQEAAPRTGAIWLSPAGVSKAIALTAPIPQTMHLQLPMQIIWTFRPSSPPCRFTPCSQI